MSVGNREIWTIASQDTRVKDLYTYCVPEQGQAGLGSGELVIIRSSYYYT